MSHQETIGDYTRKLISDLIKDRDPREARSLATLIMQSVTGLSKVSLLRNATTLFPDELLPKVKNILHELKEHKPVQYILGETVFYGNHFRVTPAVLIPRPETEELIQWFLDSFGESAEDTTILDIGTGSGCIAISLAKLLPNVCVYATDISEESLEIARRNACDNNVRVLFYRQDVLHPGEKPDVRFQYILSNPPYVPLTEKYTMQPEVSGYEPEKALFIPDKDPLLFYRAILEYAGRKLLPGGCLMVEVHEHHAEETKQLFTEYGMTTTEIRIDINGKDRFVRGFKPNINKL